jgi:hypothetical protein
MPQASYDVLSRPDRDITLLYVYISVSDPPYYYTYARPHARYPPVIGLGIVVFINDASI